MSVFGPIPLKPGYESMSDLANLIMKKKAMQQEAELKKYEIEQMAPYKTALMNYQNALTESLPMRYLSPQGKLLNEESHLKQGGSPAGTPQGKPIVPGTLPYYDPARLQNTGMPQNPDNQNNIPVQNSGQVSPFNYNEEQYPEPGTPSNIPDNMIPNNLNQPAPNTNQQVNPQETNTNISAPPQPTSANQYTLKNIKTNVPASVLSKDLYATNIDKTLASINIKDLTYYNNPVGYLKLKYEQGQDALGLPTSKEYEKYKEAEGAFDFLANQIRQFYGDSIQPSAMAEKVKKLDPRAGFKSAKTAETRFNSQKKLLKNELQTYRDATKDTDVYAGESAKNESIVEGQAAPEGNVWMMTPEGEKVPVHKSNVNHAIKEYKFKKVE